jgi:hypothetical protein
MPEDFQRRNVGILLAGTVPHGPPIAISRLPTEVVELPFGFKRGWAEWDRDVTINPAKMAAQRRSDGMNYAPLT